MFTKTQIKLPNSLTLLKIMMIALAYIVVKHLQEPLAKQTINSKIKPCVIDGEQDLFLKVIKGGVENGSLFTQYVLLSQEQRDKLISNKQLRQGEYEVFYEKTGHEVSDSLNAKIMLHFALLYLGRPLRYIVNDLPIDKDKEFFTENDFIEEGPLKIPSSIKAKFFRYLPEKVCPILEEGPLGAGLKL